jgi:nucleoside-diphosphate-sugar epimerase
VLLARAGLVLGPYEVVGRLPWWLRRIGEGGVVPAPGPRDRPLQYVDARDLTAWMLDGAERGTTGAFNAVSERGHATIGSLLEACVEVTGSRAELHWCTPQEIAACSVQGWTDLPIWTPPTGELAALHDADVSAALAAGLRCRPVPATVADAWSWLREEGYPVPTSSRAGSLGLSAAQEACLLGR